MLGVYEETEGVLSVCVGRAEGCYIGMCGESTGCKLCVEVLDVCGKIRVLDTCGENEGMSSV